MAVKRYNSATSSWTTVAGLGAQGATGADGSAPLTNKGDLLTYSTSATRLGVGNNGETLVADSSATTGLRWTATPSASNPVINGGFDIWQRGTSISYTQNSGILYNADRWYAATGANQACTISRQATSDTTNLPNIQYALRFQRNSGQTGTSGMNLVTSFETTNSIPFAGKTITLSFYARAGANYSPTSSLLYAQVWSGTGTDQNLLSPGYTGSSAFISQTATLTTTWQRFSYTGSVASTATELSVLFQWLPTGTAGAADYFEVTGVQLDIGSVALPFRRTGGTLAGELAACQRYYVRIGGDANYQILGYGTARNTSVFDPVIPLPVQMRIAPTAIDFSTLASVQNFSGAATGISSCIFNTTSRTMPSVAVTSSGTPFTANESFYLTANNSTSAYIGFSAEL